MSHMISPKASIYGTITKGDHVRIDDFSILTGNIILNGYNRIGPFCHLSGVGGSIIFEKYSSCSPHCVILTKSDDYSGLSMTNPTVPEKFKSGLVSGSIKLGKFVIVGAQSLIMPGVTIAEGCSIGAFSLVKESTEPWGIYAGIPARRIKNRSKKLLKLAQELEYGHHSKD